LIKKLITGTSELDPNFKPVTGKDMWDGKEPRPNFCNLF